MTIQNMEIETQINTIYNEHDIWDFSHTFRRQGFVKIPDVVSAQLKSRIHQEAHQLLNEHAERRDITLATTNHTPRYLSVVHSEMVSKYGHLIRTCAENPLLIDFLGTVNLTVFDASKMKTQILGAKELCCSRLPNFFSVLKLSALP